MAELILLVALVYILLGVVYGAYFVIKGILILDSSAVGSPWGFRLVIFPGVILLWPYLMYKVLKR